jgi:hypothetical protein
MNQRARERLLEERAEYEAKLAARQARADGTGHKAKGRAPEPPPEGPRDKDQYNFTDPESRIMKDGGGFEQCYNAQAAVDVATMLIVGQHVCNAANDKGQLVPTLAAVSRVAGPVANVLVDSGYFSEAAVRAAEAGAGSPTVYAATKRHPHGRGVAQLEARADPPPAPPVGPLRFPRGLKPQKAGKPREPPPPAADLLGRGSKRPFESAGGPIDVDRNLLMSSAPPGQYMGTDRPRMVPQRLRTSPHQQPPTQQPK